MAFDPEALATLQELVSADNGVPISELRTLLSAHFEDDRSDRDIDDYRLGRRYWKKLRDEIVPISDFLTLTGVEGRVCFPLDSHVPDAWFMPEDQEYIGLEVTRALGRTDYRLAEEMVRDGSVRGFLGLQDDASQADFNKALSRSRTMYNTQQALNTVRDGIAYCLANKNHAKYLGMWLLIVAPLRLLRRERWDAIAPSLRVLACPMPFGQVHVIGENGQNTITFRIK